MTGFLFRPHIKMSTTWILYKPESLILIRLNSLSMKYILLFILSIASLNTRSQIFTLLGNDVPGDALQAGVADLKALSYAIDIQQDSLWFKVETYTAIAEGGDVGFMFGFDTNMVTNDGLLWNGTNGFMNYDIALLVFQDFVSPGYYGNTYSSSGSAMIPVIVNRPDSFTFYIRVQLSALDNNGKFNLISGSGFFDIASSRTVYDDLPENTFFTINGSTTYIDLPKSDEVIHLAADEILYFKNNGELKSIRIYNSYGEIIKNFSTNNSYVSLQDLPAGIYFAHAELENQRFETFRFFIR